jgi:hypothetical protein
MAIEAADAEVGRLRGIIERHIWDLRRKHPEEAEPGGLVPRLERAVRGR